MMAAHHGYALRKGRVSIAEQIYLVTTVTQQRLPTFSNFHCARIVIDSIRFTEHTNDTKTLAFVVMPDHLHWLFSLGHHLSLSQVVANIKRRSAYRINEYNGCAGLPVWQKGFHDFALRDEKEIKTVARYIVANPLRAGLVETIGDYPFWDAAWL